MVKEELFQKLIIDQLIEAQEVTADSSKARIAYNPEVTGFQVGQFFNVIFGDTSLKKDVRIENIVSLILIRGEYWINLTDSLPEDRKITNADLEFNFPEREGILWIIKNTNGNSFYNVERIELTGRFGEKTAGVQPEKLTSYETHRHEYVIIRIRDLSILIIRIGPLI